MANSCLVQVKIDAETKTDVTNIYESLGLDLPTAIRIFFKKSRAEAPLFLSRILVLRLPHLSLLI